MLAGLGRLALRAHEQAGDRGDSGLFMCPKGKTPEPGKHCDSVEGAKAFGPGELPPGQ